MLEAQVESKLKELERYGFQVLKLRTPGKNGAMDRMILWPAWSPAPPVLVEAKRPGKEERALQAAVRDDWRARGCDVRDMVDTPEKVQSLCHCLLRQAVHRLPFTEKRRLPPHICKAVVEAMAYLSKGQP